MDTQKFFIVLVTGAACSVAVAQDSDFDGLLDSVETNTGVFVSSLNTGTDPNKADTDGDGFADNVEVLAGTDPNDRSEFPPQSPTRLAEVVNPSQLGVPADEFADRIALSPNSNLVATHQHSGTGLVRLLTRNEGQNVLVQTITPPDAVYDNGFGESLSLGDSETLFCSSHLTWRQVPHEGTAYLFRKNSTAFALQEKWTEPPSKTAGRFSINGKMYGDTLVMFNPSVWDYNLRCTTFVYRVSSSGSRELLSTMAEPDRNYSIHGVGISTDSLAVQLTPVSSSTLLPKILVYPLNRNSSGSLMSVGTPQVIQNAGLSAADRDSLDVEGVWLAVGNRAANSEIGSVTQIQAGKVFLYRKQNPGSWVLVQALDSPVPAANQNFGDCLQLQAGKLYVGAPGTAAKGGKPTGAVYEYQLGESSVSHVQTLRPSSAMYPGSEIFGSSLSKSPGLMAVGSSGGLTRAAQGGIYLYRMNPMKRGISLMSPLHGTLIGAGDYDYGSTGIISAMPDPGYVLSSWTGSASGNQSPLLIVMNSDKYVGAVFSHDTRDTDTDGLINYDEIVNHHSNPDLADSDGDGFDDGFEVNTGFSPILASSTPDTLSSIRTAVEFRFNAANGGIYRIEASINLNDWSAIETDITGQGGIITRFYSVENQPKRYFRVRRNSATQ